MISMLVAMTTKYLSVPYCLGEVDIALGHALIEEDLQRFRIAIGVWALYLHAIEQETDDISASGVS